MLAAGASEDDASGIPEGAFAGTGISELDDVFVISPVDEPPPLWDWKDHALMADLLPPRPVMPGGGTEAPAPIGPPPPVAMAKKPIKGINQAKRHQAWPTHIRPAVCAEIHRVFVHQFPGYDGPTIVVITASEARRLAEKYGDKVQVKVIVVPIRAKYSPTGELIKVQARITYGDTVESGKAEQTYSPNVGPEIARIFAQLHVNTPGSRLAENDVPGAYYQGQPAHFDAPEGRVLLAPIPPGWEEFGYPQRDPKTGEQLLLLVRGKKPPRTAGSRGHLERGVHEVHGRDMRVHPLRGRPATLHPQGHGRTAPNRHRHPRGRQPQPGYRPRGLRSFRDGMVGTLRGRAQQPFSPYALRPFLGAVYRPLREGVIELSGPKLYADLQKCIIAALGVPGAPPFTGMATTPMQKGAMEDMRQSGPEVNAIAKSHVRATHGLSGFIACNLRPDAQQAFGAIAQHTANNLTERVFRHVIQLASYLVKTKHLNLTFRRLKDPSPRNGGQGAATQAPGGDGAKRLDWAMWGDSSAMNDGEKSWGGFCAQAGQPPLTSEESWDDWSAGPHTGAFAWRSLSPRKLADSSMGSELILASMALKRAIGLHITLQEMGLQPEGAAPLMLDALGTIEGVDMDRISNESRHQAARLGMLRAAVEDGVIQIVKAPGEHNVADILTKPLCGAELKKGRYQILGMDTPDGNIHASEHHPSA